MHYTPLRTSWDYDGKLSGVIVSEDNTEVVWEYGHGNVVHYDQINDMLDSVPVPMGWMLVL